MRLERAFLKGKLAKRIFLLFVVSALVPVVILAGLYRFQGGMLLMEQVHGQLAAASETYATALYDRLLLADEALRNSQADLNLGVPLDSVRKYVVSSFQTLAISPNTKGGSDSDLAIDPAFVAALSPQQRIALGSGQTTLITQPGADQNVRLLMLRAVDPQHPEAGILVGEVRNNYLWADQDSNPYLTELCVFSNSNKPLTCSHGEPLPSLVQVLAKQNNVSGNLNWQASDDEYVGHYREVFLDARFNVPHWVVVAGQRRSDAFDSLAMFETVFWAGLGVSVLLALMLSVIQIRRTMDPLERLIAGTDRLRERDFSARVEISSGDEFEKLASSFNNMSSRLGRQFDVMRTLSLIDNAILRELDVDRVMEEVLLSLSDMYDVECAGILARDRNRSEESQLYAITRDRSQPMMKHKQVDSGDGDILLGGPDGFWMNLDAMGWQGQRSAEGTNAQQFFNFPISFKSGLGGVLFLGFKERIEFEEEDVEHIRGFADRISVALTSVARGEQLFRQARYDSLTGLPNRFLLVERVKQEIAQAQRSDQPFALLYIDLDRFKQVNDSLGHSAGDRLLQEAAHRLRQCVRESDTVARVGGDEFTIILSGFGDKKVAAIVADHVLTEMSKPFMISGTENFVSASIGIVVFPQDGANPNDLLSNADTAMYRSKNSGRAMFTFFEESMNAEAVRIATLDRELRHALSENQLMLHYQPQIDLRTGTICAVEALVRWQHPQRGLLSPETFIDFAEDSGLIVAVGDYVLREACRQLREWRDSGIQLGRVSVNVSGKQFRQDGFVETVEHIMSETDVAPNWLGIEITENILLHDIDQVSATLSALRQHGIKIELDDFGTGYSSMSYLEKLPVDSLKIDQAFVRTIDAAGRGGVIAKLVLDMARSLEMSVIAEGIQYPEHLSFMRANNCDIGQGFLFSKPLPAEEVSGFFVNWNLVTRNTLFPRPTLSDQKVES